MLNSKGREMAVDIAQLLAFSVKNNASDLHLSAGVPPMIRVDGDVKRVNMPPLSHKEVHSMIYDIMNDKQRKDFEEFLETDFSFEVPGVARFRVNAFNQNRGAGAVFRTIPSKVLSMEDPGIDPIFIPQRLEMLEAVVSKLEGPEPVQRCHACEWVGTPKEHQRKTKHGIERQASKLAPS